MGNVVNYGVIGTSWITSSFIEAARKVPDLKLAGVYSRSKERAAEFALQHAANEIFTSLEEMADSKAIDAVYIASPNSLHYEQSKLFLQKKKHVICEKPIAVNSELVKDLFKTAQENNVIFMEAYKCIHMPQLALLLEAMKKIGKITAAKFDYCQLSSKYPALERGELPNIFNPIFNTGCIMDIGIYCVYPALFLFGKCDKLSAYATKHPNGIDLCGGSILSYSDKIVTLTYSKVGDGRSMSELIGDKGTITIERISNLAGITLHHTDGSREIISEIDDSALPMQFEAESFYNYITNFEKYSPQYEYNNELCIAVSDTLKDIRKACNMAF